MPDKVWFVQLDMAVCHHWRRDAKEWPRWGFRLAMIEIDIEFEELEEKTAPQADTTYLEFVTRWR